MTPQFVPGRADLVVTRWGARFMGRRFRCSVGRNGIGVKQREGDLVTPLGVFGLADIWVRPDRADLPGARMIGIRDAWCDDPREPAYNTAILRAGPGEERLRRADHLYDLIGVVDYNTDPILPGAGSAIFLHMWRKPRHPTAGCVAFARPDIEWILRHWTARSRIIVR